MTKIAATLASTAAALLLAGNAFAQMPAAGEGPFFQNEARIAATNDSQSRAKVSIQQVASGEMSGVVAATNDASQPTRAEVRQQTREASANGQRAAIGERSGWRAARAAPHPRRKNKKASHCWPFLRR